MLPLKLYPTFVPHHNYKKVRIICLMNIIVGAITQGIEQIASHFKSKVDEGIF